MPKVRRLKPRRTWTNRLAWAVWKQRQNNKLRAASDTICRLISNFNGVDSYAEFVNDIVLVGDFEFEVTLKTTQTNSDYAIFDSSQFNTSNGNSLVYIDNPDGLQLVRGNGVGFDRSIFGEQTEISSGNYNVVSMKRVGTDLTAYLNSIMIGSVSMSSGDVILESKSLFGGVSRYMNGSGKDLRIWENGDRDTGTLLVDLPMDEGIAGQTGTVNYINRTGNTNYNATGYNIATEEDPDCASNNVTYEGDNVTYEGDQVVY